MASSNVRNAALVSYNSSGGQRAFSIFSYDLLKDHSVYRFGGHSLICSSALQALRRLAQNREAARKSRLRKKVRGLDELLLKSACSLTYTSLSSKFLDLGGGHLIFFF